MDPFTIFIVGSALIGVVDSVLGSVLNGKRLRDFRNSDAYKNLIQDISNLDEQYSNKNDLINRLTNTITNYTGSQLSGPVRNAVTKLIPSITKDISDAERSKAKAYYERTRKGDELSYREGVTQQSSAVSHLATKDDEYSKFEQPTSKIKPKRSFWTGALTPNSGGRGNRK